MVRVTWPRCGRPRAGAETTVDDALLVAVAGTLHQVLQPGGEPSARAGGDRAGVGAPRQRTCPRRGGRARCSSPCLPAAPAIPGKAVGRGGRRAGAAARASGRRRPPAVGVPAVVLGSSAAWPGRCPLALIEARRRRFLPWSATYAAPPNRLRRHPRSLGHLRACWPRRTSPSTSKCPPTRDPHPHRDHDPGDSPPRHADAPYATNSTRSSITTRSRDEHQPTARMASGPGPAVVGQVSRGR